MHLIYKYNISLKKFITVEAVGGTPTEAGVL
jgi:hypothetical protein